MSPDNDAQGVGEGIPRVLLTSPPPDTLGGIQVFAGTLSKHFGPEMTVFVVGSRRNEAGVFALLLRAFSDNVRFVRTLATNSYDVVHINTSFVAKSLVRDFALLLLARLLRKRVLVFFHGWPLQVDRAVRARFSWVVRLVLSQAQEICVLAEQFKVTLAEIGVNRRVHVETTFVDDELFASIREDHLTGRNGRRVVFIARMIKAKGVYEAIDAFRLLRASVEGAELIMAGDGPELRSVMAYAAAQGVSGVSFPGAVHGMAKRDLLVGADVLLFPSHGEGLPIVILEAMASGLPVVTTRVGGIPGFFVDGTMGFSCDQPDARALAGHLSVLLTSAELRRSISVHNLGYAKRRFLASTAARRLLDRYRAMVGGRPSRGGADHL